MTEPCNFQYIQKPALGGVRRNANEETWRERRVLDNLPKELRSLVNYRVTRLPNTHLDGRDTSPKRIARQ